MLQELRQAAMLCPQRLCGIHVVLVLLDAIVPVRLPREGQPVPGDSLHLVMCRTMPLCPRAPIQPVAHMRTRQDT